MHHQPSWVWDGQPIGIILLGWLWPSKSPHINSIAVGVAVICIWSTWEFGSLQDATNVVVVVVVGGNNDDDGGGD